MAKHVVASSYTVHFTDVCVVEFDGTTEELQAVLDGDDGISQNLIDWANEDVAEALVPFARKQPESAYNTVLSFEEMADKRLDQPTDEHKTIGDLPPVVLG